MRRVLTVAVAVGLGLAGAAAMPAFAGESRVMPPVETTTQLPRGVWPLHYAVNLTPHAQAMRFDAETRVDVQVDAATQSFVVNALDLEFDRVTLTSADGKGARTAKVTVDADAQTATFAFDAPVQPGRYVLSMRYKGKINTQANGLFALDYDTDKGKRRALFTQFEASDARRMIPGWDEPNYKATFDLSVTVPAGEMAVSNMPAAKQSPLKGGLKRVTFQRSPKMSSYLLFFATGDFERKSVKVDGVDVGVVARRGSVDRARFVLESSRDVLREYNAYFGTRYPLPKLDTIGGPGQSSFFIAMENWGGIFTFEYGMLIDPKVSTIADKQLAFETEAHEIAHQWFGDLVTMRWWDDLWLNEGFASWMAGRTTEKLHPEWKTSLSSVRNRAAAMGRDAVATTHPVVQHVKTVAETSQAFDTITYVKGEAVLRMLEGFVGDEAWRKGVGAYMKQHAYGNTVSDDLWQSVENASNVPVLDIAHDFTLQPGIPQIDVASSECRDGKTTIVLDQGEYTTDRPDKTPSRWRVPVMAQVVGQPVARAVIQGHGEMTLQGCGPVLVNAGQSGYFRTHYTPQQVQALGKTFATLPTIDQLGLLDDVRALGLVDKQPMSDYLELADRFDVDSDPKLWGDFARTLMSFENNAKETPEMRAHVRAYARAKLRPVFDRLGWDAREGEDSTTKQLRSQLIGVLSLMEDPDIIREARAREAASAKAPMQGELREAVLSVVARHADAATWDRLHAQAKAEKDALIRPQLYMLLAETKDPVLAQRALDLALAGEAGETTSAELMFGVSGEFPDMVYDFVKAHREAVAKLVDANTMTQVLPAIGGRSHDPKMIDKLLEYEKSLSADNLKPAETAIVGIRNFMRIRDTRMPEVDAWLVKHAP